MTFRFLFFLIASLSAFDAGAKQTLTVLTAYHEEVVAQFETAFERNHPDIDVKIIWRMPHDALPYLSQPKQGSIDVYWSTWEQCRWPIRTAITARPKWPVRPAVYAEKTEGQFDPFEAAARHPPVYDPGTALPRLAVQNALFDQFLAERHDQLQQLWRRLRALETQQGRSDGALAEVRHLLTAAPISLDLASDITVQQSFAMRMKDADADKQVKIVEQAWRSDIDQKYQLAEQLLTPLEH